MVKCLLCMVKWFYVAKSGFMWLKVVEMWRKMAKSGDKCGKVGKFCEKWLKVGFCVD